MKNMAVHVPILHGALSNLNMACGSGITMIWHGKSWDTMPNIVGDPKDPKDYTVFRLRRRGEKWLSLG